MDQMVGDRREFRVRFPVVGQGDESDRQRPASTVPPSRVDDVERGAEPFSCIPWEQVPLSLEFDLTRR